MRSKAHANNLVFDMLYKRFLLVIAAILVIAIIFGAVLFLRSQRYYSEIIYYKQVERLKFVHHDIESEIETIKRIQYGVMMDENVDNIRYLYASSPYFQRYQMIRAMMDQMKSLKNSSRLVSNAEIYFKSIGKVIGTDEINDMNPKTWDDMQQELFKNTKNTSTLRTYNNRLIVMEAVTNAADSRDLDCVLIVELDQRAIEEQLKNAQLTDEDIIVLTGGERQFIVSSARAGDTLTVDAAAGQQVMLGGRRFDVIRSESEALETQLLWLYVDNTNQVVIGIALTLLLSFIAIIAAVVLSGFLESYRRVYHPLKLLLEDAFEQVRAGNFKYRITRDEPSYFAKLYDSFNGMVGQIDFLIEQDLKQQLLISHAQLKHLQAQINPHFMYNSYYLLYRMIKMKDYENSVAFCEHLGKFYEYITRDGEDEKRLREEVEHARNYAAIQGYRFKQRVKIDIAELPERWADTPVPRLILQPLLENAFQYVFEKVSSDSSGCLSVSFRECGGELAIRVENSGELDTETVQHIRTLVETGSKDGQITALTNIHRRLQIYFKTRAGLSISKSRFGGLCVEIRILNEESEGVT
ncbi:sensor histidine kinase [Paenibacillus macerans]|uniref:Histidine kinase family protein n=1 Tax=Paenibacillus macerans TaxID=44252 RepID=A0A090ZD09_PAEMA|nr:histidine kinase [Paenibacillus macerans]KFN08522.1 histidine kinase family protein [Paenibacillus macerans]MBS5911445.1 histidine kinase [Paenibacillus macerans]MCY7559150.1 histidine kinase [Paenibacillus macerans]MDU5946848.1 histidine kinase [Paenibacillus macerans]MEC0149318.1 histidine kinase [Paenibacillus macerans]